MLFKTLATQPQEPPGREPQRSSLPLIILAGFVSLSVILDRVTAHDALTFHDPRSPILLVLGVALGAIGWHSRDQLPLIGRAGMLLCVAGVTSNLVCLMTDPDGVSDYLHIKAHGLLLAFNLADIALLAGAATVITSVLCHRLTTKPIPDSPTRRPPRSRGRQNSLQGRCLRRLHDSKPTR
jgi:hypothetical protein